MDSHCVCSDEVLTENIQYALSLGLPTHGLHYAHDRVAVLVASGPSIEGQLESIKRQQARGRFIFAVKDAHDWLIHHGVVPHGAFAVDPLPDQWQCFRQKHPAVCYFISSQCHRTMFDHLNGHNIFLCHLYFNDGKAYPEGTPCIGGGTTTGLRAITLLYTMGFRRFELYGYDCSLTDGQLRVGSSWQRPDERDGYKLIDVHVGKRIFICNPEMASQAHQFQKLWTEYKMPEIIVQSYGDGVITAILEEREKQRAQRGRQPQEEMLCQTTLSPIS